MDGCPDCKMAYSFVFETQFHRKDCPRVNAEPRCPMHRGETVKAYCENCGWKNPDGTDRARAAVEGAGGLQAVEEDEGAYQAALAAIGD